MAEFEIYRFIWEDNEFHATRRATREQIESVLFGAITATKNPGEHDWGYTGEAEDGTKWHIIFDMVGDAAKPITAWRA